MPLNQRQLIIGTVKMKDRYLYKEIICTLSKNNNAEDKNVLGENQLFISKTKDEVGQFILHHACVTNNIPVYVINVLVTCNRGAVKAKTDDGDYPLHLSLEYEQSETIVLQLLQAFPEAAQSIDNFNQYPLEIACLYNHSETVTLELLKAFPEAAQSVDDDGYYPLHAACMCKQSETVVLELIKAFPEAARHKSAYSSYPLHCACAYNFSEKVVIELMKVYPEAAKQKADHAGHPLHIACAHNAPLGVIKALVFRYPEALHIVATKRPYDWACKPHRNRTPILENVEYLREVTTSRKKTLRQFNKKRKVDL